MILFIGKFMLLFLFCSLAYYLFKIVYYNIGKNIALKTPEGTKTNRTALVFVKNGTTLNEGDYFMIAVVTALWLFLR
ncbi:MULTISPECIES: hypothetical protein [Bacillus amyloliquefaciens group]|uniref:hypothetical protein n=1 Tax=Bacillus amyloliquefaciens group TaxID=1938374 RepID=UPI0004DB6A42|nr:MULTISPECIES: hypothetical protein [Bacillus amyloliquefaciens group]AMR49248.1 hypothetical protein A1R12_02305 [Bacillus amyloliquefaciens]MEC2151598.1 hypothetical protein [Bacillus velezensis]MEC2156341.1 hypothetical protein [Bacillus velezensis]NER68774.1 hypothetical protein [Bacillus velezensis]UBQ46918.1 hypothetical protein LCH16_02330 [Bacillus velezensis]